MSNEFAQNGSSILDCQSDALTATLRRPLVGSFLYPLPGLLGAIHGYCHGKLKEM